VNPMMASNSNPLSLLMPAPGGHHLTIQIDRLLNHLKPTVD
jgi:hypothetical protein